MMIYLVGWAMMRVRANRSQISRRIILFCEIFPLVFYAFADIMGN